VADVTINKFVGTGTAAVMGAFNPVPPTPATPPGNGYLFWNTDDETLYAWDGAAWTSTRNTVGQLSPIGLVIDGGGATLTTGIKGDIYCPYTGTITAVTLVADQTGDIVVDIWKDSYANYPPTDADSITAAAVPTISAGLKAQDTTLTGWTTAIAASDVLRFNIDSVTAIQRLTIQLTVSRTS
jgi:hypothetical protein